jgi:hypothetical protein
MATIHSRETMHATLEQLVEALTDFGPSPGTLLTPQRNPRRLT